MAPVSIGNSVVLSKDAVFRDLDGEAVVLDLASGGYFGLNPVATRIWLLIEQHGRLQAVLDELIEEYESTPDDLERDLLDLVSRLAAAGLGKVT
jgi:coenzyme PQQ synthesis protein D (PqqD)